jgi:hypothetical protein
MLQIEVLPVVASRGIMDALNPTSRKSTRKIYNLHCIKLDIDKVYFLVPRLCKRKFLAVPVYINKMIKLQKLMH